jgi:hypothetical protein
MSQEMFLWHYTTGEKFVAIIEDRILKPTACRIDPGERPAVWFSANQWWEKTASKILQTGGKLRSLSMAETAAYGKGLVRFGVERQTAPISWREFRALSGISPATYRNMAKAGKKRGANPGEWFASFEPVPRELWVAVEVFQGDQWMAVEDALAETRTP